ncbi:FxsA family protein [Motilibacter deserti]|uniref:FxsA family protein n=1 Tax=Motilibacter deserti TaxID=2714956 RepID=A0ABX0GUY7_9ACTN|nr:FxsA family protein [Motilibacter deserti]NHC14333.1 FxsA family protein [Motilibacter deserti]
MPLVVLLVLVGLPVAEVYTLVQVAQETGAAPALLLLLATSLLGLWLLRREGVRAWSALRGSMAGGQLPGRELADAALVLLGAGLLSVPGFLSDVVGLLLLFPPTRALARSAFVLLLTRRVARRLGLSPAALRAAAAGGGVWPPGAAPPGSAPPGPVPPGWPGARRGGGAAGPGRVIEGEVVDPDDGPAKER